MKSDCRGVTATPFENFDTQFGLLRGPVVLAEGTSNGTALKLPGAGRFMFLQKTGAIANSGSLAGSIEESADGSTGWVAIGSFTAAGANTTQKLFATTTKLWVRHVAVVTGGGSGTVAADAAVAY